MPRWVPVGPYSPEVEELELTAGYSFVALAFPDAAEARTDRVPQRKHEHPGPGDHKLTAAAATAVRPEPHSGALTPGAGRYSSSAAGGVCMRQGPPQHQQHAATAMQAREQATASEMSALKNEKKAVESALSLALADVDIKNEALRATQQEVQVLKVPPCIA